MIRLPSFWNRVHGKVKRMESTVCIQKVTASLKHWNQQTFIWIFNQFSLWIYFNVPLLLSRVLLMSMAGADVLMGRLKRFLRHSIPLPHGNDTRGTNIFNKITSVKYYKRESLIKVDWFVCWLSSPSINSIHTQILYYAEYLIKNFLDIVLWDYEYYFACSQRIKASSRISFNDFLLYYNKY